MNPLDKMDSEKALYTTKLPFDEDDTKKRKICSKTLMTGILAVILVGLCIVLTVEFLYPVEIRYKEQDIDEVAVYNEKQKTQDFLDGKGPWELEFLINPSNLCETFNPPDSDAYKRDPEVKLLMLVPSAISHFEHRRAIRRTWGSVAQQSRGPFRLGFVLGTTPNATEAELIEKESMAYGDIIQANFEDTYRNLTTKSVLMLKWVSKHCPHAQYFLKADDDTFVNLHHIAQILQKDPYQSTDNFITGFMHQGAAPFRDSNEKYYVSEEEFPGEEFPPYVSGSAYMSTGNTASQLYEASKRARPFLPLEDIFVTGFCADDIDAMLLHEPSFIYQEPPRPITWDSYKPLATAHSVTPDDLEEIWKEMTKSIFDSFGMLDMDSFFNFPGQSSSNSETKEDLLVFPNRNINRNFFESSTSDLFSKIFNLPGDKIFSGLSSFSSVGGQTQNEAAASLPQGILDLPETEVFNITFFVRK